MTPERIQVQLYFQEETDLKALIPTFHDWVREEAVAGLLIDVADYRHVPSGPGLLLMGHEGDYSVSNDNGRTVITYKHKRDWPTDDINDRVALAVERAQTAAQLLTPATAEEVRVSFPDRLNAPNTVETFTEITPVVTAAVTTKFQHILNFLQVSLDPRHMFGVRGYPA